MAEQDKLVALFTALDRQDQRSLLAFAEFLHGRAAGSLPAPSPVPAPEPIPRPEQESVVAAMKRLSRSYPMVDKSQVLHQASALMAEHIMQGKDAVEVIDELEVIFERRYRKLMDRKDQSR